ncbi:acyl-CoA dehydrogenase family protein [Mycolicibacterium confluentis]|uniref:Acyl-CoA dehydrogenase n=1 Tax=Mycolicibacterium confluentis TaxID=28047 RepID=A0A7I7Y3F7_9MYCO|nr:acyl-CoA dehydrogenase family protein [Mycolicibacterium confluentis]MCV7322865.1 acyl-CoA/acyl-ACP dehydrogenase [Mycolicibacterium confluentis]BBZ35864.1 acyl-CoA dehydrogenase [Mycolicibacterium confluentis]
MSVSATAEQKALREAVSALMTRHFTEERVRELMATDTAFDEAAWQELADMGLLGLLIPEEQGGAGAGYSDLGIVVEELGSALFCGPFLPSAVLTPALLLATADDAEQGSVLPKLAAGELVATVAFAEGNSTEVPTELETTATESGGQWTLTGEKKFVLDAGIAGVVYVLAQTDAGPSVFAAEADAPGLEVTLCNTVDLTRKLSNVRFDNTPARLVGQAGAGADAFGAAVQAGSIALVSEQAGGAQRAMRLAVDYAKTRFQFGRAIGSFQAVKHMCTDMLLEAESSVSAARHVAAAFDAGADGAAADLALAQGYCSDAYVYVAATGIQVHGGIGFTWEHASHLYLRRARSDAQLLGTPASHRERYLTLKGA